MGLVKEKQVKSDGMILVTRDAAGVVHVTDTGSHLGRKGAGWGGGVGVLVGLAAPPMLGAVAVGAGAGALVGRFAKHKVDSGLEAGMGDKLKPGTAAIIAMVDDEDRLTAERALNTPAKSARPDGQEGCQGPQGGAVRGSRQVQSRTARCCRSRTAHSAARPGAPSTSRSATGP